MADEKYSPESNDGYGFSRLSPSGGARHVDVSAGTEMPDGILSMKPIATGNTTLTARASINVMPNRISAPLRSQLPKLGGEKAARVRDVVNRKR